MRYSRGFTLVELSITIALIAMIAMVAVPSVTNASRYDLRKQGLSKHLDSPGLREAILTEMSTVGI